MICDPLAKNRAHGLRQFTSIVSSVLQGMHMKRVADLHNIDLSRAYEYWTEWFDSTFPGQRAALPRLNGQRLFALAHHPGDIVRQPTRGRMKMIKQAEVDRARNKRLVADVIAGMSIKEAANQYGINHQTAYGIWHQWFDEHFPDKRRWLSHEGQREHAIQRMAEILAKTENELELG